MERVLHAVRAPLDVIHATHRMATQTPRTEYSDTRGLVEDLQRLLSSPELADTSVVTEDGEHLAAHSDVLRARSPYFEAALREPWRRREALPFRTSTHTASNTLEFLTTGCVQLQDADDAAELSRTAHAHAAYELAELAAAHVGDAGPEALPLLAAAERHEHPPPEPLHAALRAVVVARPIHALDAAPRAAALLLAEAHALGELDPPQRVQAAAAVRPLIVRLAPMCTADERAALARLCSS